MDQRKPEHLQTSTTSIPIIGLALVFVIASFFVATSKAYSANGAAIGKKDFPVIQLSEPVNGNAAVNALGGKLPDLAAYYGYSVAEFARMLRTDPTLTVDTTGRLYYVEPAFEPAAGDATDTLNAASYPLENTFTLHSKPGSQRVIYLDFNGETITGTRWNEDGGPAVIESPEYDTDNNPGFSNTELANIQAIWRQVAEDYAPFDVDVTTEDPGSAAIIRSDFSDQFYGSHVVITEDNFDNCGCGGFAYVGVFDYYGSRNYQPAFVFNSSVVGAGEAASHEVGHNLGLSHDGTSTQGYYTGHGGGNTGWAPIMGVGYSQSLVQWSKGEYFDANQSQDDFIVIQNNGLSYLADDHSDTLNSATALPATSEGASTSLTGAGVIERRSDADIFSFVAGAGSYTIAVDPVPVSPNLDIEVTLLDSAGNTITTDNPSDELSASLSGSLSAGEYYLVVEGVGKGDVTGTGYSDYGSLGRYSISGSVVSASSLQAPLASISADYDPGTAPRIVLLDGSGSSDPDGTIENYQWTLGDGTPEFGGATMVDYSHQYSEPGTFTVRLTVTDNDGLSANDSIEITVENRPPVAVASAEIPQGAAPSASVSFTGSGSSDPDIGSSLSYDWDFGDGSGSTEPDPVHVYTAAGTFNAMLTVTDNLGDSDSATVPVVIDAPAFVQEVASGQILVAGSVSGGISATYAADGSEQVITERESSGKKRSRYSYLEHIWQFDVSGGDTVTLLIEGRRAGSEDESMVFAYALAPNFGADDYVELPGITLMNSSNAFTALLPGGTEGEVRIRVQDGVREGSDRTLRDQAIIDQLVIQVENGDGGPVDPPPTEEPPGSVVNLRTTSVTSSEVELDWQAGTGTVPDYYTVDRSSNGGSSWLSLGSGITAANFTDANVFAGDIYSYRVIAVAGTLESTPAVLSGVQIPEPPAGDITLQASGTKIKGTKTVTLEWVGADPVLIERGGLVIEPEASGNIFQDSLGKGGGTYVYQVCAVSDQSNCSSPQTVVF